MMDTILILVITFAVYLVFYLYFVKKNKIYKSILTQVVVVSISSLGIGYLISEIRTHFTFHLLILILLFTSSLIFYSVKLVKNHK